MVVSWESPGDSKVGIASCESYFGLVAIGDCSIKAAMKKGGITQINYVDYGSTNILGFYAKFTVIVNGD